MNRFFKCEKCGHLTCMVNGAPMWLPRAAAHSKSFKDKICHTKLTEITEEEYNNLQKIKDANRR